MTVGIGLVCNDGKSILLGADMRASYGAVTSNDKTGKLFDLPFNFCGAIAGTIGWCSEIISELHYRLTQLRAEGICAATIRKTIYDSYDQVYLPLVDETLRNNFKITIDEYKHDSKLSTKLRDLATRVLRTLEMDVDLIVSGFVDGRPIQFVASGGTTVEVRPEIDPGNALIGSGKYAALNWLNYRKQSYALGLAQSLLHFTEAKQFAEVEQTVGPLRQIVLLEQGVCKPLDWTKDAQDLVQGWWNRYGLMKSDSLAAASFNDAVRSTFGLARP